MVRAKADDPKQQDVHNMGDKAKTIWLPANQQLSQTFLAGRKGPSTPIPSWKLYENPFYEGIMAAVQTDSQDVTVSARKLAATLWGLQQRQQQQSEFLSKSKSIPGSNPQSSEILTNSNLLPCPPSPSLSNSSLNSAKPSVIEVTSALPKPPDKVGKVAQTNRQLAVLKSQVQRLLEKRMERKDTKINSLNNHDPKGVEAKRHDLVDTLNVFKHAGMGDPQQLLKALSCIHDLDDQHTWSTSLAEALLVQLDHAGNSMQELEVQYKAAQKEIENLQTKIVEARATWRSKEQEKIKAAVQAAREEVEEERKSKKRLEFANKELIKELADANAALSRERKARELIEDVCEELAREMAEDKTEMEESRRESAMVREEVEEERKMLQVAELLREERVQMKLIEAQHELEERIAALNNLKSELEEFLAFDVKNNPKHPQNISNAESLCISVEALLIDKTSLLSGYKDERSSIDMLSSQIGNFTADLLRDYEPQGSKLTENETFLKDQKSKTKSIKHKSRTNQLSDSSKRSRTRSKFSKKGSVKDEGNGWDGANASETKKSEDDDSVESDYAKFDTDPSVILINSEDSAVNFDLHHVHSQIDSNTEHSTSEQTIESDLQNETSNTTPIWRSNTLATEDDLNTDESAANQQERGSSSLRSFVSSESIIYRNNWASMDSRNQYISKGAKGSTEGSKNGLKRKQEKQQKRSSWKTFV